MFRTSISTTPFTTDVMNKYFHSLFSYNRLKDNSLISTLRALLVLREGENAPNIPLYISGIDLNGLSKDVINDIIRKSDTDKLDIISIKSSIEDAKGIFETIDQMVTEKGYQKLEKVTEFNRNNFLCSVFINIENRRTIAFISNLEIKKFHYFQLSLTAILPWIFNFSEKKLSEEEKNFIFSLKESTGDNYLEMLNSIYNRMNLREFEIKAMIGEIEKSMDKEVLSQAQSNLSRERNNLSDLNIRIQNTLTKIYDFTNKVSDIQRRMESGNYAESPILEYFLSNKNIDIVESYGSEIVFNAKGYIDSFDEDVADSVIRNKSSYCYYSGKIKSSEFELLLKAIFIDYKFRIKTCAQFKLDIRSGVVVRKHASFPTYVKTHIPNPHLNEYACLGNNSRYINEAVSNRDYVLAIAQCEAANRNINFGDSVVMETFMKSIQRNVETDCAFLETESGELVTVKQALEMVVPKKDDVEVVKESSDESSVAPLPF